MANTYRAISAYGKHVFGDGDVFEHEFTASDEQDALSHVEIVPREYRVLSDNYVAGEQGDVVSLALLVEHEAALVSAGVLERVDPSDVPAGNAKREEWAKYALRHGATEDDLLDEDGKELGRDELRDKFGGAAED